MSATLAFLVTLLAAPDISIPTGGPIKLDGLVGKDEWKNALAVERKLENGGTFSLKVLRIGPDLALAAGADRTYAGETLRMLVTDKHKRIATAIVLGTGNPELPPAVWRRAAPAMLMKRPPQCPRGCRARVHVGVDGKWSAEFLVSLSSLGIGRGDLREFKAYFAVAIPFGDQEERVLTLPANNANMLDPAGYARLVTEDQWGNAESWAPVSAEASREFDDHELLRGLHLEHDKISLREQVDQLVIASAVRPRKRKRIDRLYGMLGAGRSRNPTLSMWNYFMGRLMHESNHYDKARKYVEAIPKPLSHLDPYVNLAAEHYLDTEEPDKCRDVLKANPEARGAIETYNFVLALRKALDAEKVALQKDAQKSEKNPRVRIETTHGDFVCELFEDDARCAVLNFMDLVKQRYYDGLAFHSVLGGLFAQTGDPRTKKNALGSLDGPPWNLRPDASRRPLLRGYLATVPGRAGGFNGGQFIITVAPLLREELRVAVFGRVVEGRDVVERLELGDRIIKIEVISKRNHPYDAVACRLR